MTNLVERLRSNGALAVCPFDKRSPDYYTTPNDKPCKFCGSLPEGPDKCTGADMRIMSEAADAIAAKDREIAELRLSVQTVGDQLGVEIDRLLREIAELRQRTIEECAKVADEAEVELFEYPSELASEYYRSGGVDASVGIAAAIRSLGKEGSGE